MGKRTIFGIDRTPRKALWAKLKEQERDIKYLKAEHDSSARSSAELLRGLEISLEASNRSLRNAEITIEGQRKRIVILESKLSRYVRLRGKNGKFVKK